MSEREKKIAEKLAQTISALPPEKQQYILGYAEGAADIASRSEKLVNSNYHFIRYS